MRKLIETTKELDNNKIYYQPCLFSDRSEISTLRDDQSSLLAKLNNLRRGVFKRLDDLVKACKEIMLRQDERDLEMSKMQARIDMLEQHVNNSKSNSISRNIHIVGRKRSLKPFYMLDR